MHAHPRRTVPPFRSSVLLAAVTAVLLGAVAGPALGARSQTVAVEPRVVGLAVAGAPTDLTEAQSIASRTGAAIDQVTFYVAWSRGGDFPAADASRILGTGAVPELTWEPWDPTAGLNQPRYALDTITAGAHDAYLTRWARQIKAWNRPLVIRLAHEMNGSWYPWAEGVNGNGAGDHAAAWRHVVGIFRRAKVTNVTWTWAANVPYAGSTPLSALYPGDAYVGRVGLDGYNWGTTQSWSSWQSFGEVFGPGVSELRALSTRPIHISETGAPEGAGGDKAAWLADMWSWLDAHPEVRGVTYFSFLKEADWRVDSSEASLAAWGAGARRF